MRKKPLSPAVGGGDQSQFLKTKRVAALTAAAPWLRAVTLPHESTGKSILPGGGSHSLKEPRQVWDSRKTGQATSTATTHSGLSPVCQCSSVGRSQVLFLPVSPTVQLLQIQVLLDSGIKPATPGRVRASKMQLP